jgi:hypothetical protein
MRKEPTDLPKQEAVHNRGPRFRGPRTLQDLLALGYVYLLVLGVVSDSIYYGQVGVTIMRYSTVLDVLLSPIVHLTDNLLFPVVIVLIPVGGWMLIRGLDTWHRRRSDGHPVTLPLGLDLGRFWLALSGVVILSAYLGLGMGGGRTTAEAIRSGGFLLDHEIEFADGERKRVRLLGSNSSFAFYLLPDAASVTVAPLQSNIRTLRRLTEEERTRAPRRP